MLVNLDMSYVVLWAVPLSLISRLLKSAFVLSDDFRWIRTVVVSLVASLRTILRTLLFTADVMLALNTVRASSDSTRKSVRDLCFRIGRRFGETNQERMTCDAERKYGSMKGPRSKKATVR